ncbi:MAG TPA: BrnT family toxin [Bacteroidia bacterium]|jgi:uncharacterized DUF497 family protein|nr:BrnT family toxin [Bacteroidia bacterium]
MGLFFEWDTNKAKANILKHKVSFEEASTVFGDNNSITIDDPVHSLSEKRYITLGLSANDYLLVVVHTERGEKIRIISARRASTKEKRQYEK